MVEIDLQDTNMKRNQKGFTLVEVIVVLVILAILAAILVPSLTGYIDKAKDKVAVAECRACVQAAQMILTESYAQDPGSPAVDAEAAKTLAEVDGTITAVSFSDSAKVEHLSYTSKDDIVVVYCAQAGEDDCGNSEIYTVDGTLVGGATTLIYTPGTDVPGTVFENALSNKGFSGPVNIHSTEEGTGGDADKIKSYLTDNNIEMSDYNIKSWALLKESGYNEKSIMWWTDQDISQYEEGDQVRVIRYNPNWSTYTAGYMKVGENTSGDGTNYKVLKGYSGWTEYKLNTPSAQTAESKASYEETLKYYNEMDPQK